MGENKGRTRCGMKTIEPREGRADGNVLKREEKRRRVLGEKEGSEERGVGINLKCSVNEVCYLVLRVKGKDREARETLREYVGVW